MKAILGLFAAVLLMLPATSEGQTMQVSDILARMNQAVVKFEQGQFTFHDKITRFGTDKDTTRSEKSYLCFFKKNSEDTLLGYQVASFREDGYQELYNGEDLFVLYDKKLEVIRKKRYPTKISDQLDDFNGSLYMINTNKWLQYDKQKPVEQQLRLIGTETVLGEKCFKLLNVDLSKDLKRKIEVHHYISTESFLPIRTVYNMTVVVGKAEETEMIDYWVTEIHDKAIEAEQFSRNALSEYQIEKKYDPAEQGARDALLPLGSNAPDWKLPLITGDSMKLSDLKGKIVVLDFWFKSCAPCVRQMVELEAIHKKFPSKDVVMIGVNTVDDPEKDKLDFFLKNRLISMNSVHKGNSIASLYKVYASPALFVINKERKVVFTKSGYSTTILDDVSKIIDEQLK